MSNRVYTSIVRHYEECLHRHGATYRGMDWPNDADLRTRFEVMLGVIREPSDGPVDILDLGCGVGLLLDHFQGSRSHGACCYIGIDLSREMIEAARARHPQHSFEVRDVIESPLPPQCHDYIVMNGVITEKGSLSHDVMEAYARTLIKAAYQSCRQGLAFNVMSTHVDWERADLFHWSVDDAVAFLIKECSRNIVVRMDYGLYEYTFYVYRTAGP